MKRTGAPCDQTPSYLASHLDDHMVSDLKATYEEQGYVVVHDLISEELRPQLEAACTRVINRTRSGGWPHRRTVGKQFPPYGDGDPDSWGVQHLMHPDLGEPIFAQWYTSKAVTDVAKALLECSEEDLQMGIYLI